MARTLWLWNLPECCASCNEESTFVQLTNSIVFNCIAVSNCDMQNKEKKMNKLQLAYCRTQLIVNGAASIKCYEWCALTDKNFYPNDFKYLFSSTILFFFLCVFCFVLFVSFTSCITTNFLSKTVPYGNVNGNSTYRTVSSRCGDFLSHESKRHHAHFLAATIFSQPRCVWFYGNTICNGTNWRQLISKLCNAYCWWIFDYFI